MTIKTDQYGKKIKDSFQKMKSMKACRELEIKYGLKQITEGAKEDYSPSIKPIDYRQGDIKRQMAGIIKSILNTYRFQSLGEYNAILSCFNIQAKYTKGTEQDNLYHGIVYSTTDHNGNLIGNQIKSSRLGKYGGYQALTKAMLKTKDNLKKQPVPYSAKSIITKIKKESADKSLFIEKLEENNIDVVIRTNEEGRLYGITFIDHVDKLAFNGSRIGKEFSANTMNDWFNTLADTRQNIKPAESRIQEKNTLSGSFSPAFQRDINISGNAKKTSINEESSTFHVTAGTSDPEEEVFIRNKEKGRKISH